MAFRLLAGLTAVMIRDGAAVSSVIDLKRYDNSVAPALDNSVAELRDSIVLDGGSAPAHNDSSAPKLASDGSAAIDSSHVLETDIASNGSSGTNISANGSAAGLNVLDGSSAVNNSAAASTGAKHRVDLDLVTGGYSAMDHAMNSSVIQTPEELGFTSEGDIDPMFRKRFGEETCLDLGAKGFPLPVFNMLKEANWDPAKYFEAVSAKGFAEDALQMTGPEDAILKSNCMKQTVRGRLKHVFVGDSQMMTLRNAFHRLNKCPEVWWTTPSEDKMMSLERRSVTRANIGRLHSGTEQAPDASMPRTCPEEGIGSYIYWDAWSYTYIPIDSIKYEIQSLGLDPKEDDTVVVWVGSNFIPAEKRMSVLQDTVSKISAIGAKLIWDSPTFVDAAIMTATSSHDSGKDPSTGVPIAYTEITSRKSHREIGSDEYRTEKEFLLNSPMDVAITKRWQLTNRYRGLQCDGFHTDMRGRDPLYYTAPCPRGETRYGDSVYCNWVEPFKQELNGACPMASGVDDLVLQSGLYGVCAGQERPFCYSHAAEIR